MTLFETCKRYFSDDCKCVDLNAQAWDEPEEGHESVLVEVNDSSGVWINQIHDDFESFIVFRAPILRNIWMSAVPTMRGLALKEVLEMLCALDPEKDAVRDFDSLDRNIRSQIITSIKTAQAVLNEQVL